ncbi:MAG: ABC transporter permease [Verrucomicrobiales bacterium]|nr:ABC transporter permease [Verrucomicrobiales bacterium]
MSDLRFALRQLLKSPGFTAVAVLTLAICLGANLTILGVVDAILLRALPFAEPERLAIVFNRYPGAGIDRISSSLASYFDRRSGAIQAFASVSIYQESSVIVSEAGRSRRVPTMRVSPEFFATLGVPLALGQPFQEENLAYRADEVAVLTDEFWRGHFNADPNVIGRTFDNDGARISVIGVLPRGFRFLSSRTQFFRPASHDPKDRLPAQRHSNLDWNMVARLAPGAGWQTAQAQMDALNAHQLEDDPIKDTVQKAGFRTQVASLHEDHVRQVKRTLVLLQVGVVFLLLIGVVNLANLLLIRASGRTQEMAVRQALGAGRWQLARSALAEVLLLVLGAAATGLLFSAGGLRLLSTLGAEQLPLGGTIRLDGRLVLAGLGITALVGVLLALLLTGFSLGVKLAPGLKLATRGGTAGRSAQKLHHGFVVAQVALAFVLLSGAGLLGLSLQRVLETPVGFNTSRVVSGRIAFPWSGYTNQALRLAFVDRLVTTVRALPGVSHVALNSSLPFTAGQNENENAVAVEGWESRGDQSLRSHHRLDVTPDYWRALDIPLLRGRLIEDADRHRQPRACVVDQAVAQLYWPGADPIGRRFTLGPKFDPDDAFTVAGVVAGTKHANVTEPEGKGAIYLPYGVRWPESFSLVVRSSLPDAAVIPMIRQAVAQCDPGMPIDDLRPVQSLIDDSLVVHRSPAVLAAVFAGVALLLASLGTYGVLAYAVSQRQREIGVRLALGARPGQVLAQFFGQGARLCLLGLAIGVPGAWAAGRAMQSALFGVGAFPPGLIIAACLSLAVIVSLAILLPSLRASRVDPMAALRSE